VDGNARVVGVYASYDAGPKQIDAARCDGAILGNASGKTGASYETRCPEAHLGLFGAGHVRQHERSHIGMLIEESLQTLRRRGAKRPPDDGPKSINLECRRLASHRLRRVENPRAVLLDFHDGWHSKGDRLRTFNTSRMLRIAQNAWKSTGSATFLAIAACYYRSAFS
jgi:hypothetical protein